VVLECSGGKGGGGGTSSKAFRKPCLHKSKRPSALTVPCSNRAFEGRGDCPSPSAMTKEGRKDGRAARRNDGTKERRNERRTERKKDGTNERRNDGTKEPRKGLNLNIKIDRCTCSCTCTCACKYMHKDVHTMCVCARRHACKHTCRRTNR
jgi:hypothetical protein